MIRITVAIALPGRQEVIALELADGATVADAVAAARLGERFPGMDVTMLKTGIWSREASLATVLRDADRVEVYRALKADPKAMRRSRARLRPSPRSRSGP
jgi:putative ubiquitin-RnfH superfamily antitoxin RatB of RatAB toxin-antitoxin module